jgi:drug/metabolite transporter (DMT)-like permease
MSHQKLSFSQFIILILVPICASFGNACLDKGMKGLPELSLAHPMALITVVFTPWVTLGIVLLIGFFACYLTALSWADLSYVMLATAWGNVLVVLLSHFVLHEPVSWQRWFGVLLITAGVGYVAPGPTRTAPPAEAPALAETLVETQVQKGSAR